MLVSEEVRASAGWLGALESFFDFFLRFFFLLSCVSVRNVGDVGEEILSLSRRLGGLVILKEDILLLVMPMIVFVFPINQGSAL